MPKPQSLILWCVACFASVALAYFAYDLFNSGGDHSQDCNWNCRVVIQCTEQGTESVVEYIATCIADESGRTLSNGIVMVDGQKANCFSDFSLSLSSPSDVWSELKHMKHREQTTLPESRTMTITFVLADEKGVRQISCSGPFDELASILRNTRTFGSWNRRIAACDDEFFKGHWFHDIYADTSDSRYYDAYEVTVPK